MTGGARFINYIIKYIEKNPIRNESHYLYMASRGLKIAERFSLSPLNVDNFPNVWQNDYIKKSSFYLDELSHDNYIDLIMCRQNYINNFQKTIENLKSLL